MRFYTSVERVGDIILSRGYDNGKQFFEKTEFKPTLFIPAKDPTNQKASFSSIEGVPLLEYHAGTIKESSEFVRRYEDVPNFKYYGQTNWVVSYIADHFKGVIDYDFDLLKILYFDIETDSEGGYADINLANKKITAITACVGDTYYVFGTKPYEVKEDNVRYFEYLNEQQMLIGFVEFWERIKADIVTGWNVEGYDIPYLIRRLTNTMGNEYVKRLSPWGIVNKRDVLTERGPMTFFTILGMSILDYLPVFKKFSGKKPDDNKLNTVAHLILKEKKIDYSEFKGLDDLYKNDYQKFIEYNIKDVYLIKKIEEDQKLLELVVNMALSAKVNFNDVFMQTRLWDAIIYNDLLDKRIVIPQRPRRKTENDESIEGGFVKDPVPGMYDWVVSLDLTSLYPSLIMHYNIGPETFRGQMEVDFKSFVAGQMDSGLHNRIKNQNLSLAANGTMYDRNQKSFISRITGEFFAKRKAYKDKQLETEREIEKLKLQPNYDKALEARYKKERASFNNYQMNYKILLNALYGSLANAGFRFYDRRLAEAITLSGQLTAQWAARKINEYMNGLMKTIGFDYVIASDTDSLFVNLKPLVDKLTGKKTIEIVEFIDQFCEKKLQPKLNDWFLELANQHNAYEQKLHMKREKICEVALWTAKKRYICSVWDKEGTRYPEAKVEVTGIEAVRSDTPEFCRDKLKESFKIILKKDQNMLHQFIEKTYNEFRQLKIEEISTPTGVKGISKYASSLTIYGKKCPMHVRGALLYNKRLKDLKLEGTIEKINEGDKIKYVALKLPNPIREDVIAFSSYLPKELGLHDFIDYKTQWNKTFLSPLEGVTGAIGWNTEEQSAIGEDAWQ